MAQVILGCFKGWRRCLRLLPFARDAARAGVPLADALGSGMGRAGGYSDGRDLAWCQLSQPWRRARAADVGGVGAQYAPAAGWAQSVLYKAACSQSTARRDRGSAWRRRELRDRWILGGANDCDYATIANAVLHRGQWLRHLCPVALPDPGLRHCRQSRQLQESRQFQRRRHRPAEAAR